MAHKKVAFQGEGGAYSEDAALEYFGPEIVTVPCPSFDEVFTAVETGGCACGIVPIENSLAGSIHRNYDLLFQHGLFIVGEHYLRIRHCLIGLPGSKLSEIRKVFSHPQALAQCDQYLRSLPAVEASPAFDTAGSVRLVQEGQDRSAAAIASRHAAEVYEMQILAEGIENDAANYTRFLILATQPVAPGEISKTSLIVTLPNVPGSLYRGLHSFAVTGIDLTKIESRPLVGKPWEYLFYADLASSPVDPAFAEALRLLQEQALMLRVLGSYPAGTLPTG